MLWGWVAAVRRGCAIWLKLEVMLRGCVVNYGWLGGWWTGKVWGLDMRLGKGCRRQRLWRRLLLQRISLWQS